MDPTVKAVLGSWHWRPDVLLVLLVLGTLYITGWWRLRHARARGADDPPLRGDRSQSARRSDVTLGGRRFRFKWSAAQGRKGLENQNGDPGGIRTHVRERGYGVAVRAFSKSFSARAVLKTPQMQKRARYVVAC